MATLQQIADMGHPEKVAAREFAQGAETARWRNPEDPEMALRAAFLHGVLWARVKRPEGRPTCPHGYHQDELATGAVTCQRCEEGGK